MVPHLDQYFDLSGEYDINSRAESNQTDQFSALQAFAGLLPAYYPPRNESRDLSDYNPNPLPIDGQDILFIHS